MVAKVQQMASSTETVGTLVACPTVRAAASPRVSSSVSSHRTKGEETDQDRMRPALVGPLQGTSWLMPLRKPALPTRPAGQARNLLLRPSAPHQSTEQVKDWSQLSVGAREELAQHTLVASSGVMYFILDGSRDEKVLKEGRHDPGLEGVVGRAQSKDLAEASRNRRQTRRSGERECGEGKTECWTSWTGG